MPIAFSSNLEKITRKIRSRANSRQLNDKQLLEMTLEQAAREYELFVREQLASFQKNEIDQEVRRFWNSQL